MDLMTIAATPWFEPNSFGAYYGALGGGIGGSLIGLLAPLSMYMAQRGRARTAVLVLWAFLILVGTFQLGFSAYALASAQPYGIWYPPGLCGLLFTLLSCFFVAQVRRSYTQAESRKIDAAAFRNS